MDAASLPLWPDSVDAFFADRLLNSLRCHSSQRRCSCSLQRPLRCCWSASSRSSHWWASAARNCWAS